MLLMAGDGYDVTTYPQVFRSREKALHPEGEIAKKLVPSSYRPVHGLEKSQDFLARTRLIDQAGTSRSLTASALASVMVASGENGMPSAAREFVISPFAICLSAATRSTSYGDENEYDSKVAVPGAG